MIRAFQWDLARQVERLPFLKQLLPRYAAWGYQELYLHLEDAVHYPSLPGIGRADAYTHVELGDLVKCATQNGIRVVPIINLLGHTQYLIKHPGLRDLNELRDDHGDPLLNGQICPLHPRIPEVAEKLIADMQPFCTAGKVHVGLDESFQLGKCPRCRADVDRIGLARHFAAHVSRLHGLVAGKGLKMGMWADMLYFIPEAIASLPAGITAYDWYYYPFNRKPRVELYNFAERDLHPALKKQGIRYFGCPMNGAFRYEPLPVFGDRLANIRSWWQRCHAVQADGMLITSWEAYRLALETTTVVDAAAASLWLEPGPDDATTLLARGLERALGSTQARPQARALLAADDHAFTGYARWQINDRWDVFAGNESLKPYLNEERFYERMVNGPYDWPAAFGASLAFRLYLARRDVFVRKAAREVFRWRRLLAQGERVVVTQLLCKALLDVRAFGQFLKQGKSAARAMWARTRNRRQPGKNEEILIRDQARLDTWRRWLIGAIKDPERILGSTPLSGPWQLQLQVHNLAPAAQKILVEQLQPEGNWLELASRHTIEFRSLAARPLSKISRELTTPIDIPSARLRLRISGYGRVGISHVRLSNGVKTLFPSLPGSRGKILLGSPSPKKGLPALADTTVIKTVVLNFL